MCTVLSTPCFCDFGPQGIVTCLPLEKCQLHICPGVYFTISGVQMSPSFEKINGKCHIQMNSLITALYSCSSDL